MSELPPHQLLGLYDSPFVRRVAVTMTLYQLPFEHLSLSVFRQMDAMRAINPLYKVPLLTLPDGEKLYESAYQLDYLDELAAERGLTPLTPRHGAQRRQVQQLMARAVIATEKAIALVYEGNRPAERQWPEWAGRLREQMHQAWAMLEECLAGDFLYGGRLTQADVTTVAGVSFIRYVAPQEWPTGVYRGLEGLAERLEASAAFIAVPQDR